MRQKVRRWLEALPLSDRVERQQAVLLQIMLFVLIIAATLALPITIADDGLAFIKLLRIASNLVIVPIEIIALVVLRRGYFRAAVQSATIGLLLALSIGLLLAGIRQSGIILVTFTIPLTLAGLLGGRRGLLINLGLAIGVVLIISLIERMNPPLAGFAPPTGDVTVTVISTFILTIGLLSLFLDRFGTSLRDALTTTQARERELEKLRAALETAVAERTISLQQALQDGEQREMRLALTLEDLRASQEAFRELSAPVIPVLPGVLVAPLIGVLDSARATELTNNVLAMVEHEHAHHVIFDITGVPLVDTHVAQVLLQTTTAVRLLGAQSFLVGIRPEVAQTMVALNLDMGALRSYSTLRDAIGALLAPRERDLAP